MNTKSKTKMFFDEEDELIKTGYLPYVVNTRVSNEYIFPLDEEIGEPSYYRNLIRILDEATESDCVRLTLNNGGGRGDTCSAIIHAIRNTEAMVIAEIVCDCHSAASLIALSCDVVLVSDFASMLCHSARFGTGGKSQDVLSSAQHHKKISDKMIREAYEGFLDEDEIEDVLKGKELYLDSEEIVERLAKRQEYFESLEEFEEDEAVGLTD